MDESEKLVELYLKTLGFADLIYEPDGNVPPDFVAGGQIAIEVRRLNQHCHNGPGLQGLEVVAIPLWRKIREFLAELGPGPKPRQSWYVFYDFSRPVPAWKSLKSELKKLLSPFMNESNPQPFQANINTDVEFRIKLLKSLTIHSNFFVPAGHIDEQSGGWLLSEMEENIRHCIDAKFIKIRAHRKRYGEWWLVLPDHIGYALGEFERELFIDQCTIDPKDFDQIILLDPRNYMRSFQIYPIGR